MAKAPVVEISYVGPSRVEVDEPSGTSGCCLNFLNAFSRYVSPTRSDSVLMVVSGVGG